MTKLKQEPEPVEADGSAEITKAKPPTITQLMLKIADERFLLGKNEEGLVYAVDVKGANVAMPIGAALSRIGLVLLENHGKTPTNNARSEVRAILEARAEQCESAKTPVRVGRRFDDSVLVIDMGDEKGRAIEVRPGRWAVEDRSRITFTRTKCNLPMIEPVSPGKGSPDGMRKLFNLSQDAWDFLVNWQVIALVPDIPHVMPIFEGNPGTAKTSTTRLLVQIVDPSKGALNRPPRDMKALDVAAGGSWAFALENMSYVSPELSDGLARLITGTGSREKQLYTDSEIHVREMQRIVIMNGISIIGMRPDLLDRSITLTVPPISREDRLTDKECEELYEAAAPAHLGYLLDVLARAMAVEAGGDAELTEFGRMASFEQWLRYCDEARGTNTLDWYRKHRDQDAVSNALDDVLTQQLEYYFGVQERKATELEGTAKILLGAIEEPEGVAKKQWPATPRAMTQRLRMLSDGLRAAGWTVETRTKHKTEWWKIGPPA